MADANSIAVLGAGSWGTALAILLGRNGADVRLWSHLPEHVRSLCTERENREFLPGAPLPDTITPVGSLEQALDG